MSRPADAWAELKVCEPPRQEPGLSSGSTGGKGKGRGSSSGKGGGSSGNRKRGSDGSQRGGSRGGYSSCGMKEEAVAVVSRG